MSTNTVSKKGTGRKYTRITADFDGEAYEALEEVAEMLHSTKAEALRRALGLIRFALREKKEGMRLIVENKSGRKRKEIVTL